MMKKNSNKSKPLMVGVSMMAVLALPSRPAHATITINCPQGVNFGVIAPLCTGQVTVRATPANGTNNNGCHILATGPIRPALCTGQVTVLPTASRDMRVTFSGTNVADSNASGPGVVTLDNLRIQTSGGSQLNTHTFSSSLFNPSHQFRVGGRLSFGAAEPSGSYNNSFTITITAIP